MSCKRTAGEVTTMVWKNQEVWKNQDATTPVRDEVLAVDPQWAWAEYQPDAERPWGLAWAGHLYRRAAWGANWTQLQDAVAAGPRATVDRLVHPPDKSLDQEAVMDQDEDAVARASGIEALRAWWLRRMILSPFPLREKLTLFWHSHLGVSQTRVNDSQLMMRHVRMLRSHALGSYRALLDGAAQDPAVYLALGADSNRKSFPNERFSKQLMDRFSLGPGHYGDEDVREASRAFTGWFVLRGKLRYFAHEYDSGVKRVLGEEGPWKPQDIVRIVLAQPATPRLIACKLYRWLVSEELAPSEELMQPLAAMLGEQYDVGQVVETILRSNLFFSEHALRQRVKSPVEYAIGLATTFDTLVPTAVLGASLADLGQNLYSPPTSDGWLGGEHWINPATLLGRWNLAEQLLAKSGPLGGKLDPAGLAQKYGGGEPREQAEFLVQLLLNEDAPEALRSIVQSMAGSATTAADAAWRKWTCQLVASPDYQLC